MAIKKEWCRTKTILLQLSSSNILLLLGVTSLGLHTETMKISFSKTGTKRNNSKCSFLASVVLSYLLNTTYFLRPVLPLLNLFPWFLNLGVKSVLSITTIIFLRDCKESKLLWKKESKIYDSNDYIPHINTIVSEQSSKNQSTKSKLD